MTRLVNNPDDFPAEAVAGFADAFSQYVKPVFGGVVRSTRTPQGKVALVVGGGSGHYPAFAGWVGPGFADGAVCGNIFSSPSGAQAYSVCKAAERGAGVLIGFGNYAGDVLHFGQAVERLKADGIEARTLLVTDDIASAGPQEHLKRRGIAGDLPTFKITGAACEAGLDIDEVERVFTKANEATCSYGVAFAGCTLPGADHPLFTVPDGRMGIGLGIHGEAGVDEADLGSADEVAKLLVDGLLADHPVTEGDRVVAILNGLGASKYEEMFVVWHGVQRYLRDAGLDIAQAEVGEFVTSLDMAGISLTLVFLDEELERFWFAACDTPAYRRGSVGDVERDDTQLPQSALKATVEAPGSAESQALAAVVTEALDGIAALLAGKETELGDLDAVAGDGDHGIGMHKGSAAAAATARELLAQQAGAQTLLAGAGQAWSDAAGGTSGALWGALLTAVGGVLGDQNGADESAVGAALAAGLDAVVRLGGASVGDKTMVDALAPAVDAHRAAADPAQARADAVQAARRGAESTKDLVARLGRARPLGERSLGTPDPGATSLVMVLEELASRF
ncbi:MULTISPECIES: dihydroxyacetone kinase subunit DhaL [unclassified Luteococcus]|uniref:dihydroxyacetone kinase subunit DhaL n=1 Tax=unclassified Luteococcus TaxID=2639923 RepID=UPI00313A7C92